MLRVDVWDMSKVPTADDVVIETVQTTESAEEPAEEKVEIPSEEGDSMEFQGEEE